jgi:hypothetical protein
MVNPLVPKVNLKEDSVDLVVQIVGISSGSWAEISGYIIQEDERQEISLFVPFSDIQQVPDPARPGDIPSVTVNVRTKELDPAADVKVITRVTEVQIWPTSLVAGVADRSKGVRATWEARRDSLNLAGNPRLYGGGAGRVPAANPAGTSNVVVTGPDGARVSFMVDVVPLGEPGGTKP